VSQALCIRLDRSQQGVVPRTCLAAKPSKPKPSHLNQYARGPQAGPGPRPSSPAMGPQRPMSPGMNRPMSPGMSRPMSPGMNRPMSPGMNRPMSPGMNRPMSPGMNRPMSPGMNRPMSPSMRGPPPRNGHQMRSQSPGPYRPPPMAAARQRSNSASNIVEKRGAPAGPSKLGPGPGMAF
jgi:hypothetical protein